MHLSKKVVDSIDATPSKRIYRSIIADYDLNTAICELIDNAIDVSQIIGQSTKELDVRVDIDLDQQSIVIADNAGGVRQNELKKLISPGESSLVGQDSSIGIFGVGSKRAVVALAQLVQVTTRYHNQATYRLEYDDEWLQHVSWVLPYEKVKNITPGSTEIKLANLRFRIDQSDVEALRQHLSVTYPHFLNGGKTRIWLDDKQVSGRLFDQWAYPPEYSPQSFERCLARGAGKKNIRFQITGGLTVEGGSIGGDWGVFFYCNKRLISKAVRDSEVGFLSGQAGVPHPRMSLARVIVEFDGPSDDMPWTSNKAHINYNHTVFKAHQKEIVLMVKTFTGLSKSLQPEFEAVIRPYGSGEVAIRKLEETTLIKPSYLPKIPPRTPNFHEGVIELNCKVAEERPWTRGLYESLIAFDVVAKQHRLEQRNRILLIILDSTLEIAFKEYLANEIVQPLGDDKLSALFKDRIQVHREVEKHLLNGDSIWKKIGYYYRLRCELIHKRANVSIADESIEDFRKVVVKILYKAFKIRFPQREE